MTQQEENALARCPILQTSVRDVLIPGFSPDLLIRLPRSKSPDSSIKEVAPKRSARFAQTRAIRIAEEKQIA